MTLFIQLLVNGVFVGSIYALLGLSFATIFATNRIWHFAQGAVYTASAYVVFVLVERLGVATLVALAVAIIAAALAGAAFLLALYRPLSRRGATELVMVMASLGVMVIIENSLALIFGPSGYSLNLRLPEPLIIGGVFIGGGQMVAIPSALVIACLYLFYIRGSRGGRLLRALVSSPELLSLNGYEADKMKLFAFALGSALLPVAALLLLAGNAGISPYMGVSAVLSGAMAMFFGGVDRIEAAAPAGLLMGLIESIAAFLFPTEWQTAITYGVILSFLIARPAGLMGRPTAQSSM